MAMGPYVYPSDIPPISEWWGLAACKDSDRNLFFGSKKEGYLTSEAKKLCAVCVVKGICLEANLYSEYGIFGGTTPRARKRIRAQRRLRATGRIG